MTDSQYLLLVVAAIYVSECLVWTNLHAVAIVAGRTGSWRWRQPGSWFSSPHRGLLIKALLPPLRPTLLCQLRPVSLSPDGLLSHTTSAPNRNVRPEQAARHLAWDEITSIGVDEQWLTINGGRFAHCVSAAAARALADEARATRDAPGDQRAATIDAAFAASLDPDVAAESLRRCDAALRTVRPLCTLLFFHLFAASPLLVVWAGWPRAWPLVFGGLAVLTLATIVAFVRAHRRLAPNEIAFRRLHAVVMLLNPTEAIRAQDLLARDVVASLHPLAVLAAGGDGPNPRELARALLVDLHYPLLPYDWEDDRAAAATAEWHRRRQATALESAITSFGWQIDQLLAPPEPLDASCESYCPRCGCQFLTGFASCPPCGERPLIRFAQSTS